MIVSHVLKPLSRFKSPTERIRYRRTRVKLTSSQSLSLALLRFRTGCASVASRSLSEYLLVLSHGRWLSLGFGLFGLGPTLCAHYPPQSTPTLQERRQIFKRLWVKQISCHSADTFSRPRNRNLRIPRADLIMPNTGSTMCLCAA